MSCHTTRAVRCAIAFALVFSSLGAAAATIYGTVTENGAPLRRMRIDLVCPNGASDWRQTDDQGTYRLTVRQGGRCVLKLQTGTTADVVVYAEPTRYDFEYRPAPAPGSLVRR